MLLDEHPELHDLINKSDRFSTLKSKLRKTVVDGQTFYIAEGDLLLDEDQLGVYAAQKDALEEVRISGLGLSEMVSAQLVGITAPDGRTVRWEANKVLTYCVLRKTFSSAESYQLVVANMQKATSDWQKTCAIKFQYLRQFDNSNSVRPTGVLFPVRQIDAQGDYIAAAFFPNDPTDRRKLLVDPSYFAPNMGFDLVGVLRHELGHVLGFRHEHIRSGAPAVCPRESLNDTIDLTKYDPKSVMHYFCGGVGSRELAITEIDREGSQRIYGAPPNDTHLVK